MTVSPAIDKLNTALDKRRHDEWFAFCHCMLLDLARHVTQKQFNEAYEFAEATWPVKVRTKEKAIMEIELKEVKSSNISHVGYHVESQTLHVRFKSGTTYSYSAVPVEEHQKFIAAESIGKHFQANIRDKYQCTKLEAKPAEVAA